MLTKKFLERNPGFWDLDSLRISLYGTNEESTYFVTRHKKAYQLVKKNMIEFLKMRNEKNPDLKFGLNYIILPENIDTILELLDYVNEVNSQVDNGRGVDFITLREDFGSVTEINDEVDKQVEGRKYHLEGLMTDEQRTQLIDVFKEFNDRKDKECPEMHVDFGYAMVALGDGVLGKPLARVSGEQMRKSGYPQMSVAIDSLGDIFLYREAGFLDRPGNQKFVAGRIGEKSLEDTLKDFINNKVQVDRTDSDCRFMDSYDHLMTLLVNQTESDMNFGVGSPVRIEREKQENQISNNWYKD
jgi:dTDP-4-amino-4,6-dideoxy-D-glucose ammonia-lyase